MSGLVVARKVTILYASETGNAEEVAYDLFDFLKQGSENAVIIKNIGSYDFLTLPEEDVVLFVVSTTGDGECPSSMLAFWRFLLQKGLPKESLSTVEVGVFGLGDSSYEKYNAAGRRLMMRCKQLGAKEFVPLGLGDDQHAHGFFTGLRKWMKLLSAAVFQDRMPSEQMQDSTESVDSTLPLPKPQLELAEYNVYESESSMDNEIYTNIYVNGPRPHIVYEPPHGSRITGNKPIYAEVTKNDRMTHEQWPQNVRDISLSFHAYSCQEEGGYGAPGINGVKFKHPQQYIAGDVATIHPKNPAHLVTKMLSLLQQIDEHSMVATEGLRKDTFVSIKRNFDALRGGELRRKSRLQDVSCTLHDLFTTYLDIAGPPRRSFFRLLSLYTSSEEERSKLMELGSAEGFSLYHEYVVRERRNHVEVMEEFPGARPPLNRLLEMVPPLQPRHYSIASTSKLDPFKIDLCVAVEETITPYRRRRSGLCSTYLANLRVGDEVVLWLWEGSFTNPGPLKPLIMIGPGTGVAPMRALMQERIQSECSGDENDTTLLFFGCRKKERDFLYGPEWLAWKASSDDSLHHSDKDYILNGSFSMTTAFSQDGDPMKGKTYVIHKMRLHEETIFSILGPRGGSLFVAGSAQRMPADVRKEIVAIVSRQGQFSLEEAERFVKGLEKDGRYKVEAWS